MVNVIVSSSVRERAFNSNMMSLSEILFLSFVVSAWTAPLTTDIDASPESMELPGPTSFDDITTNDQKISVTWPPEPIAEILDPYHRGIHVIHQIADKSYQKLLAKTPRVNFRYAPYNLPVPYPGFRQIPISGSQSIVSVPVFVPQREAPNVNHISIHDEIRNKIRDDYPLVNKNRSEASLLSQIDPYPMTPPDSVYKYPSSFSKNQPSNYEYVRKVLTDFINSITNNKQNKDDGNRTTREVTKNVQNLVSPQMIQRFLPAFTNQDSVEGINASLEFSDESSESDENQSGSTMTTSATEELLTTTALPTEFESTTTTTFETTTEIPTTKSNEEEIIPSTTQSELLDKNAEIDEAVAFNIDDGDISSTQESATQFPKINKNNFYAIYGIPTLTKKDNSLILNANIGMAVALNESDINDLKITNVA